MENTAGQNKVAEMLPNFPSYEKKLAASNAICRMLKCDSCFGHT